MWPFATGSVWSVFSSLLCTIEADLNAINRARYWLLIVCSWLNFCKGFVSCASVSHFDKGKGRRFCLFCHSLPFLLFQPLLIWRWRIEKLCLDSRRNERDKKNAQEANGIEPPRRQWQVGEESCALRFKSTRKQIECAGLVPCWYWIVVRFLELCLPIGCLVRRVEID